MRKMLTGTYNNYRPKYCYIILEGSNVLRGLEKKEKTKKNCYDAYHRATDSISARVTALKGTDFIRFIFVPLNATVEVSTTYILSLQKVLQFKLEDKVFIKLDDVNLILKSGPLNWAEQLRKIRKPKSRLDKLPHCKRLI